MSILTPSLEDYLEAILVIGLHEKVVRVKDIVKFLGVKTASVVGALKALSKKNLVVHERYGWVELTEEGKKEAERVYEKHKMLYKFFSEILGVDKKIAAEDACKIEHYIHKKTLKKIVKFTNYIETCPQGKSFWFDNFHYFVKYGKHRKHLQWVK
jgi:DtxR family Mn-dependent transcriptional regulator